MFKSDFIEVKNDDDISALDAKHQNYSVTYMGHLSSLQIKLQLHERNRTTVKIYIKKSRT